MKQQWVVARLEARQKGRRGEIKYFTSALSVSQKHILSKKMKRFA